MAPTRMSCLSNLGVASSASFIVGCTTGPTPSSILLGCVNHIVQVVISLHWIEHSHIWSPIPVAVIFTVHLCEIIHPRRLPAWDRRRHCLENSRSRNLFGICPHGHERRWLGDWGHQSAQRNILFVIRICLRSVGPRCHCSRRIRHWAPTVHNHCRPGWGGTAAGTLPLQQISAEHAGSWVRGLPDSGTTIPIPADGTPTTH